MEKYEIIKSYLETFPGDTEVKDVISNIKNAEKKKSESLVKLQDEMEDNIGKCYYYTDIDDSLNFIQIYTKITGTKILEKRKYIVDESFPYITKESFKNNQLPSGITHIVYTIDLDAVNYEIW